MTTRKKIEKKKEETVAVFTRTSVKNAEALAQLAETHRVSVSQYLRWLIEDAITRAAQ